MHLLMGNINKSQQVILIVNNLSESIVIFFYPIPNMAYVLLGSSTK